MTNDHLNFCCSKKHCFASFRVCGTFFISLSWMICECSILTEIALNIERNSFKRRHWTIKYLFFFFHFSSIVRFTECCYWPSYYHLWTYVKQKKIDIGNFENRVSKECNETNLYRKTINNPNEWSMNSEICVVKKNETNHDHGHTLNQIRINI